VRKLWGVGPVSEKKLQKENILTIGDLADLSEKDAKALLGSAVGRQLQGLARGFDNRPVCERAIAKQISSESTYRTDITDKAGII
ncbi:DNA polymerase thumb domain-containing protein, partial [Escherichia coli]|uniref:DNA polymerase thumb domain-containing protein n=2 Tax=Bacteria TaxID=2 RepID=UPI001965AE56